ncbi:MAG: tetratricopeptide repeat protein [Candidatus Melainabacteria bacterium]|nr:tetratricopeptide repeat protein [Candidatus Melainabacteria bacterium]
MTKVRWRQFCLAGSLSLLLLGVGVMGTIPTAGAQVSQNGTQNSATIERYGELVQAAEGYIQQGQLTQAIDTLEKALPLTPDGSLATIHNNLAALYMRRGNYHTGTKKDYRQGLEDYQAAVYYLDYAWPEGLERKPLHTKNLAIAKDNLELGYKNNRINPKDGPLHLQLAKDLRTQGRFRPAVVEYAKARELSPALSGESLQALGDLFTVLNRADKARKYYNQAIQALGPQSGDDLLVRLGNAQERSGEVNEAIKTLDQALNRNPANLGALNLLEKIWLREVKFNPRNVLAHANLGSIYQKKKNYPLAQRAYQNAEKLANEDAQTPFDVKKLIRLNLGTLFQETNQPDLALKAYQTVLQADPNHLMANYYLATLLRDTGKIDAALQQYGKVLSINPSFEPARMDLVALASQQTDPNKADLALADLARRFPQDALLQAKIGEIHHSRKQYDKAIPAYQTALRLDPKLSSASANLAAALQALGKHADAYDVAQKALISDPNNDTLKQLAANSKSQLGDDLYRKAYELQQAGKLKESLPLYEKAVAQHPTDTDILLAYAVALQQDQQLDKAILHYQKVTTLNPKQAQAHYSLGTAFHQKKQYPQARKSYSTALSLDNTLEDARKALQSLDDTETTQLLEKALEAFNQARYPQALALVQQAIRQQPTNAIAHYYQGLIYTEQQKTDQAIASYQEAIRLNPDYVDPYYSLGVAYDNRNRKADAKQSFETFVRLSEQQGSNEQQQALIQYAKERVAEL